MRFTIATTLDEALEALAQGARPVAGGSDLIVGARQGKAPLPDHLVAIDRITELAHVSAEAGGLSIGAMVSHHELEHHPLILERATGVADASALVGSPSTRNVGTVGGNVMNASPAMDTGAPLLALGAMVELRRSGSSRQISLTELWAAPGRTTAAPDELCVGLHLPDRPPHSGSGYVRLEYRRAMEIAVVGAGAAVTLDENGSLAHLDVALSAVAPVVLAVDGLEQFLGRQPDSTLLTEVAELASAQARPISDLRASDRYRRHTVGVMARRAVDAACRRAGGEHLAVPLNRTLGIGAAS